MTRGKNYQNNLRVVALDTNSDFIEMFATKTRLEQGITEICGTLSVALTKEQLLLVLLGLLLYS